MADHVTEWLGAYLDGELRGARLRLVEQHLAGCAVCQAELKEIQNLSALLHETPADTVFLPAERFAANLALSLPRQAQPPRPRSLTNNAWWLAPVGLLGSWLFIQVTFSLSSVLTIITNSGLLGANLAWLQGSPLQMRWFATAMNLFGSQLGVPGRDALYLLNDAGIFVTQLAGSLAPQALLAAAYLVWMAFWWLNHQQQSAQNEESRPRL